MQFICNMLLNYKMKRLAPIVFIICLASISVNAQNKAWTLKACVDTAIQRNITVKQGQLNNQISGINLEQSRYNLWPNLNIIDAPGFNFGKSVNSNTGQYIDQNTTTNSFSVTSNLTLYNGLQYKNTIRQNKFIYDAGVQGLQKLKNDISLGVLADYLLIIASYEQVSIAASQIGTDTTELTQMKKYVDAGKLPILNLLQIQSQLAADKLTKVNAEVQLQLAKVNLMQLMNIPVVNDFEIQRPEVDENSLSVTPLTSVDIYKTAVGFLPEIKNAELNFNASEVGIKIAQSLYLPKLSLSGSIRTSGSSLAYTETFQPGSIGYLQSNPADQVIGFIPATSTSNSFSNLTSQLNNSFNQFIGLNLSIPIFNNYLAKNTTAIANINNQIARLNEDAVSVQLRQSIEQAYTQLVASAEQYSAAKEALETEALTYNNIEKKFSIGLISATDFLIEKSNYLKVEQSVVQAKYNYLFKIKLIDFYLGNPITI
jgi:outer membrane protein